MAGKQFKLFPDTEQVKHCRRCKTIKPLTDFSTRGKGARGYLYHTNCKACSRVTQKAQRIRHKTRMNARKRELYKQNEGYKAHARGWYQRNKSYFVKYRDNPANKQREQDLARVRKQNESPESHQRRLDQYKRSARKRTEERRAYRERTKERAARLKKAWIEKHPHARAQHENQRRARKMMVPFEKIDRAAIIKRDKSTCYLCGKKLERGEIHLDHVIPLSRGGTHTTANLRVACASCNCAKWQYTLDEYVVLCANKSH